MKLEKNKTELLDTWKINKNESPQRGEERFPSIGDPLWLLLELALRLRGFFEPVRQPPSSFSCTLPLPLSSFLWTCQLKWTAFPNRQQSRHWVSRATWSCKLLCSSCLKYFCLLEEQPASSASLLDWEFVHSHLQLYSSSVSFHSASSLLFNFEMVLDPYYVGSSEVGKFVIQKVCLVEKNLILFESLWK